MRVQAINAPQRFGMETMPAGVAPLAIDPWGREAHVRDARSVAGEGLPGDIPQGTPGGPATTKSRCRPEVEGPAGPRAERCQHCGALGAVLEMFQHGDTELRCGACGFPLGQPAPPPREIRLHNDKVLCIDDDPLVLQLLAMTLKAHGFVPLTAPNGPAGLALAAAERPRLIVVDIMMPGMDGFEVCRRLKADPRTTGIPRIILTAQAEPRLNAKAFQAGADLALTKPFDPERLIAALRAALALKMAPPG